MAPQEARVFTTEELLREAQAQEGRSVSKRLLYDWTGLGLLEHPGRPGKGQGQGWGTEWPDSQRQLFLTLLKKRHDVNRIETLCNVPVWIWLVWGDEFVSLSQARRALQTWAGRWETASKRRARLSARQLVAELGHPDVPPRIRQVAIDAVADAGETGRIDRERLVDALRRVMDPGRTGRPRGVLFQVGPEHYVTLVEARVEAARRLAKLGDETFMWARHLYLVTRAEYAAEQPRLATDPELGHMMDVPTLDELANNACRDLLTILGYVILSMRLGAPPQSARFDPRRSPLSAKPAEATDEAPGQPRSSSRSNRTNGKGAPRK